MDLNCNFSLDHYFNVVDITKKTHEIVPIRDYHKVKDNNFLIIRHDVDFSIDRALELAKLEHNHDIISTYFILLQSQYYNALSETNIKKIKEISKLNHEIGLHYDLSLTTSDKQAVEMINAEAKLLGNLINTTISSISPHNVSLSSKKISYQNLDFIDATNPEILNSVKYVSDSVQNWRSRCMCNHIEKENKLIILTHPIWWGKTPNLREEILSNFELDQIEILKKHLNETKQIHQSYLKKIEKE